MIILVSSEKPTYISCHDASLWSACSASCGGGFQTCRNLFGEDIHQDCNVHDCEGKYSIILMRSNLLEFKCQLLSHTLLSNPNPISRRAYFLTD